MNLAPSLSILAVDESALCRKFMAAAITATPGARLAGVAPNVAIAIQKLGRGEADLILLGLGTGEGLATFHHLRKAFPEIGIIITGGLNEERIHSTVIAMEAGALHFLIRPERLDLGGGVVAFSQQLQPLLRQIAVQLPPRRQPPGPTAALPERGRKSVSIVTPPAPGGRTAPFDLVAIAVSTGGPTALSQMVPLFPDDLGVPVLIVQHMPAAFTAALAESLNAKSQLRVKEAQDGELIQPSVAYLAPGSRHMLVRPRPAGGGLEIALTDDPPVKSCRPSADLLFQSLAPAFTGPVLAVIMTGMGDDGADGVRFLKRTGCYCLSQSQESCVVYGMPKAVESQGLADEIVPLPDLAFRINELVRGSR